jgi:glycosyltransferase involved in cell wall biosynthesis
LVNPSSVTQAEIDAWVNEGIVEYWGWREDMPKVLSQADIVCLPTYYGEGLPKSLLEGAASGCALVATNIPGCQEVVRHGETGWLVPPRNVPALTAALEEAIGDPTLRAKFGAAARDLVASELTLASVTRETLAVYNELTI